VTEKEEIAALVRDIAAAGWPEGLEAEREAMEAEAPPLSDDISVEPLEIAGRPAEILSAPNRTGGGLILYLHGGGYVYGSLTSHRGLVGEVAKATGLDVIQLDYRLAPECPFPSALEDAASAVKELYGSGIAPERLVLMGDSAGGGLVLATLLALRDAGSPMPGRAVCISPWTDLTCSGESYRTRSELDPMIDRKLASRLAATYAGTARLDHPRLSPLFADLAGLPPILIQVGAREVLHSDALEFAARARAAGSPVTLEEWPEMIHVWHLYFPRLKAARRAIAGIASFLDATAANTLIGTLP
jgi:acetyl esterase/lipase